MRYTRYYKIKGEQNGNEPTHVRTEVYYDKGGINYFTYKNTERGYYMSVMPVTRKGGMESYTAFSGTKKLIVPCKAKCKSRSAAAKKEFIIYHTEFMAKVLPQYELEDTFTEREEE